jgi:hypothetical protein
MTPGPRTSSRTTTSPSPRSRPSLARGRGHRGCSGCRACARHGALAPPQGHEVPSEDEAEEADGAGAETLPPTHAAAAAHARLSPGGPAEFLGPP